MARPTLIFLTFQLLCTLYAFATVDISNCYANSHVVKDSGCTPYCYTEPYGTCDCVNCDQSCYDVAVKYCANGYSCFPYEVYVVYPSYPICPDITCTEKTVCDPADPTYCYQTTECCDSGGSCYGEYCYDTYENGCEATFCEHSLTTTCEGYNYPFPCRSGCSCDGEREVCDYSSCCKCDAGFYSPSGLGYYEDCIACPDGSYSYDAGASGGCPCLPGYSSPTGYGPCIITEPPVAHPVEEPIAYPVESPVDPPVTYPVELPVNLPYYYPNEPPVVHPVEEPIAYPVESPVDQPVAYPVELPVNLPFYYPNEPPVVHPVEEPIAYPVESPVDPPVAYPVELPVNLPFYYPNEPPVVHPVEEPIAYPVESPVEPPVTYPVELPVVHPVEFPIAYPVENPVNSPVTNPVAAPSPAVEVSSCYANSHVVKDSGCTPYCYTEPYGTCDCVNCDQSCYDVAVKYCANGYSCFPYEVYVVYPSYPICPDITCTEKTVCDPADPTYCYQTTECCDSGGSCYGEYCYDTYENGCEATFCEHSLTTTCEGYNYPFPCRSGCSCDGEREVCDYSSCCKCDAGFYSPSGLGYYEDCIACPDGSYSYDAGASGGCPCLPGYSSPTGYGPCIITEPPVAHPVEEPIAYPVESPVDPPVTYPVELPVNLPYYYPNEPPVVHPVEEPIAYPVESPVDQPVAYPVELPVNLPFYYPNEPPVVHPVEDPIAYPVESPVDPPVAYPVELPVNLPFYYPNEPPVVHPAEEPIVYPVESPVEPPVTYPAELPVAHPVEFPIAYPVENPVTNPVAAPSPAVEVSSCYANSHVVKDSGCTPYCYTEPYGTCDCVNCDQSCYDVAVKYCANGYSCFPYEVYVVYPSYPICPDITCTEKTFCDPDDPTYCYQTTECCDSGGSCYGEYCYDTYENGCEKTFCEHSPTTTCEGYNYPFPCRSGCSCDGEREVCDYSSCCKCDAGFYSPSGLGYYEDCIACPEGSYSYDAGASGGCPCLPGYSSPTGYGPCYALTDDHYALLPGQMIP